MTKRNLVGRIFGVAVVCVTVAMITSCISLEGPKTPFQSGDGLIEKLTLDELTARAESILVAEVGEIACYKDDEGNIYTLVTLSIEQNIKGETQQEVVIRIPGGELNGQTLWVEDAPSFQLGERTVVFLEECEGTFSVVGGFQGKFTIDSSNMVDGDTPLSQFIDQIRDILAKQ